MSGPFVLRGRAGTAVNVVAAVWLVFETVNIAWPRNTDLPWWQNYAFLIGIAAFGLLGLAYFLTQRPDRRFELGGAAVPAAAPAAAAGRRPDDRGRARAGADLTHSRRRQTDMGMFHHHGNGKGHRHGGPKPSGVDRESLRGMQALKRLADIKDRREREQLERGLDLGLEAAPSVNDRTISTFSRGQQPAFAGINTFLKAPYCENIRDVGNYDVAILGAPFDMGTTYRAGCRFGPQAVRRISALYDSYNADMARRPLRGAQPLRRGRRLRHPVEPREVLRPDRPRRLATCTSRARSPS